jgi:hypothetical protein
MPLERFVTYKMVEASTEEKLTEKRPGYVKKGLRMGNG